jgi:hypothetical protein
MNIGQCLCGKVRFEIDGELGETRLCYCELCRRANGTAFSANVPISVDRYRLIAGREHIREYESSAGVFRAFCSNCGSPVYARIVRDPAHIRIAPHDSLRDLSSAFNTGWHDYRWRGQRFDRIQKYDDVVFCIKRFGDAVVRVAVHIWYRQGRGTGHSAADRKDLA